MTKTRVFITRNILHDGANLLKSEGLEVEMFPLDRPIDQETLYEKSQKADALICMLNDTIDRKFIYANPHLKVISNYAVGFNNIDVAAASELKIPVGNTPDVLTNATAELALGLMFSASRNFGPASLSVHNGEWKDWHPTKFLGPELSRKTLGIIGMGRIGKRLAEIATLGLQMKVIYATSTSNNLIDLLKESDFISLHVPLNDKTRNLIGKKEFQIMKPTAVLINTARGEIVNQDDLIWALENNIIYGAGLDVTTPEPLPLDSKLLSLKNVFITPHLGSGSLEARKAMSIIAAENVLLGLKKENLKGFVNPQIF